MPPDSADFDQAPVTRGFLFADLRDYTVFVERRGDRAAVELLAAYRSIVRDAVRAFGGAEIKTKGDSFYVVFPSVSAAITCALRIQAAARSATADRPDRPIRVGIGVHAGESAAVDDGYVGLAVNVAARICSEARPGDVLVSDTVRALTRGGSFAFRPIGKRRLKGVTESVMLYAAAEDDGAATIDTRARQGPVVGRVSLVVIVAGSVVALVGLAIALGVGRSGPAALSATPTPRTSGSPTASVLAFATETPLPPLPIGDGLAPHVTAPPGYYRTSHFRPTIAIELDTGWEAIADDADGVEIRRQTRARGNADGIITFLRPLVVHRGACMDSPTFPLGRTPQDAIAWLNDRADLKVSSPEPVTIGDIPGLQVTMSLPERDPDCPKRNPGDPPGYYLVRTSQAEIFLVAGERVDITALTVGGENVLIVVERLPENATAFDKEIDSLLPTVQFQ